MAVPIVCGAAHWKAAEFHPSGSISLDQEGSPGLGQLADTVAAPLALQQAIKMGLPRAHIFTGSRMVANGLVQSSLDKGKWIIS